MKKMKPILFSTPMVEAILSGRKTQTRRIVKQKPGVCMFCGCTDNNCRTCIERTGEPCYWTDPEKTICSACDELGCTDKAPFQPGDILWVRETWDHWGTGDGLVPKYIYRATDLKSCGHKWKPSIFMPKDAARIFLKVINVRVERLNDIREEDAINEGVIVETDGLECWDYLKNDWGGFGFSPIDSFCTLWESISGVGSWTFNPYVWVCDFKQIEKEVAS